ncbi:hypothetical protein NHX12_006834 [Muraenolepis orangiensis]|uniref:Uncharacterized protein n=1 Tax=Muraenolepis orangiensis TaxID=630683 RepID=A0A9Q0I951_9TELE|nr:hypothetical protein NHX12_006834 [Muraenolepis orangiensis]
MTYERLLVSLVAVLWLQQPAPVHGHQRTLKTYRVSVGKFLLLKCSSSSGRNVTWSKGGDGQPGLPPGVEVKGLSLWFLPVAEGHQGTYVCHSSRERDPPAETRYEVQVTRGACPTAAETRLMSNSPVQCKLEHPQGKNSPAHVQWLKECVPVDRARVEVTSWGALSIPGASERDVGLYTCLLHLSLGGHNYTAARSIYLTLGTSSRVELPCKAFLTVRDHETHIYWTINRHFDPYNSSWNFVEEGGAVYAVSSLVISSVVSELLGVPIVCHVNNPSGQCNGTVWLRRADHSGLYVCVLVPLTLCLVGLSLALGWLFRVELVLAFRKLRRLQDVSDGKLYDAYVSYLYSGGGGGSSEVETFALKVLPEVLEKRHGFRLFIRGRDDCPGEALHDAIAGTMSRCRRLVLILSAQSDSEASPLDPGQSQLVYEHSVGLYDALTLDGPGVILVEIGVSFEPKLARFLVISLVSSIKPGWA